MAVNCFIDVHCVDYMSPSHRCRHHCVMSVDMKTFVAVVVFVVVTLLLPTRCCCLAYVVLCCQTRKVPDGNIRVRGIHCSMLSAKETTV